MNKKCFKEKIVFSLLTVVLCCVTLPSYAQSGAESDIEALYDRMGQEEVQKVKRKRRKKRTYKKTINKNQFSELSTLEPLSDIAVMQRRFLPTEGRFEVSTLLTVGMNNAFFNNFGLGIKTSYFFSTQHAIELQYLSLSPSKKDISNHLSEVGISAFVASANDFKGLAYKWTPVYGKSALFNKFITHYDTYFVIGGGLTGTDLEDVSTIVLGLGQNYTVSKSLAFKVDVTINSYTADSLAQTGARVTSTQSDIYLSLGASFYFPEATYR